MKLKNEPGRFSYYNLANKLIGEITFTQIAPNCISIDHTFVHPSYRNQGIARKLLQSVLQLATEKNWQIVPVCPYAKKILQSEVQLQPFLKKFNKSQEEFKE